MASISASRVDLKDELRLQEALLASLASLPDPSNDHEDHEHHEHHDDGDNDARQTIERKIRELRRLLVADGPDRTDPSSPSSTSRDRRQKQRAGRVGGDAAAMFRPYAATDGFGQDNDQTTAQQDGFFDIQSYESSASPVGTGTTSTTRPTSASASASANDGSSFDMSSFPASGTDQLELPSRKRPRDDVATTEPWRLGSSPNAGQMSWMTPGSQMTGRNAPSSALAIDMQPEDLAVAQAIYGCDSVDVCADELMDVLREQERLSREKLEQERRDEEFARRLQADEERQPRRSNPPSGPTYPVFRRPSDRPRPSEATEAATPAPSLARFGSTIDLTGFPDEPLEMASSSSQNFIPQPNPGAAAQSSYMPGSWGGWEDDDGLVDLLGPSRSTDLADQASLPSDAPFSGMRPFPHANGMFAPLPDPRRSSQHSGQPVASSSSSSSTFYPTASWANAPSAGTFDGGNSSLGNGLGSPQTFDYAAPTNGLARGAQWNHSVGSMNLAGSGGSQMNTPVTNAHKGLPGAPTGSSPFTNPSPLDFNFGPDFAGLAFPNAMGSALSNQNAHPPLPQGGAMLNPNVAEYYDYVTNDPTKTRDEIRSLLENIRPDSDLPKEGREGTPEAMKYPLMEHQKLGLMWLKKMEAGSNKGGILADDMGLGKTIQALALMVSRPSKDPRRKSTLIVAPVALLRQWKRELETKLKSSHRLRVVLLHGSSRNEKWSSLREHDVVLTTYGTLASEYNKRDGWQKKKAADRSLSDGDAPNLPLLGDESKWYRVILDEAQCIKNRTTKAAQAACALQATSRFCLTGTPMMNNVAELHSLIEFLRIKPYNEARRFNHDFTLPLKKRHQHSRDQAMKKLQALLKALLLRRTKQSEIDGKPIIQLPPRTTEIQHAVFDDEQLAFYTALESRTQLQFNRYLKAGTMGKNYSNVLVLLLRLRQACCHPHLIHDFADDSTGSSDLSPSDMMELARQLAPDVVTRIRGLDAFECPVCYDAVANPAIFLPCGHDTCSECFVKISDQTSMQGLAHGQESSDVRCPQCRGRISSKKSIDYNTFKKVHMPELAIGSSADCGAEDDDDDDDDFDDEGDSAFGSGSDDGSEADSDAGSLKDFIVPDDEEEEEAGQEEEDDGDDDLFGDHASGKNPFEKAANLDRKKRKRETTPPPLATSKPRSKKHRKRVDRKGKGKAEEKTSKLSLAELKKGAMRNAKGRRAYMRRLEKDWIPSAKVDKCCEIIEQVLQGSSDEKVIVFSQFTSLLDLLEVPITRKKVGFERYDGSMSATQRNDAVLKFSDPTNLRCRIMLVSLKAGNSGLNLVAASHVIILDPFWNPFIEEQAIDRTHRIGQQRPVKVHRILVKDTVEDRIIALQEKKRQLIEGALDEAASQNISRLGLRELAFLFGMGSA